MITLPLSPPGTPPEQFVRIYWERVSEGKYDQAWAMLTDNFKCTHFPPCEGGNFNFQGYQQGFAKYSEVDVRNAYVVNQDANSADVKLDLEYHWKDGTVTTSTNFTFHLVAEPNWPLLKRNWFIDKVTQSN